MSFCPAELGLVLKVKACVSNLGEEEAGRSGDLVVLGNATCDSDVCFDL